MKLKGVAPFLFLILSLIACAWELDMGDLKADGTPVVFESIGERPPTWTANVEAGAEYEVTVRSTNETPAAEIRISIYDLEEGTYSVDTLLAGKIERFMPEARVTFFAPSSGKVGISVMSGLGDYGEKLGQFSIQLRKLP